MIKTLKNYSYTIIFLLFFLTFLPLTIIMPAQTNTRAIVTGISLDKKDNEYSMALQLITPQSNISNNENLEIVDDTGSSFYECLNNLSIKLGKTVGLEHTNIIILGASLKGEDIINLFDYMFRNSKITLSTIIIQTDGEAKKLLETSAELNNTSSSSIQNNLGFNENMIETSIVSTLGSFYNDYFSHTGISVVPLIEGPKEEDSSQGGQSGSQSTGGEQGSGGGSSSSKVQPIIQNNGESVVFKKGIETARLSKDLVNGFSLLKNNFIKGLIKLDNVTDNKFYNNSRVNVQIENGKVKVNKKTENEKLILDVNVELHCYVSEIINEKRTYNMMQGSNNYLTPTLIEKIKEKINNDVQNCINFTRKEKLDIYDFYENFYRHNKKELIKILNKYGNDYLNACEINLNIRVYPYR